VIEPLVSGRDHEAPTGIGGHEPGCQGDLAVKGVTTVVVVDVGGQAGIVNLEGCGLAGMIGGVDPG
jgi:hypothetical protein